ncbi:MAG: hypothetical protein ACRDUW_05065 [Pseudonocardiaceae bacterium]
MTDVSDMRQRAVDELASEMVPTPDDVLTDCGPLATLWFLTQTAYTTMSRWTSTVADEVGAELKDGDEAIQALVAISQAAGILTGACVLMDMLPEEADSPDDASQATT